MTGPHRARRAATGSFPAAPRPVGGRKRKTRLTAFLAAYLVGALATYGLIRLAHAPDWVSAVSLLSSLVSGAVTSTIQKKLDTLSVPVGRIVVAVLVGIMTVALPPVVSYWHAQRTDIDARRYITASGNTGMGAGQSATFKVQVPSYRDYLTVQFAGTPGVTDGENCINGASLEMTQSYGATRSASSTIGFDRDYSVEIPTGVERFTLSAIFLPQPGFSICASDVTVASAYFHN